MTDAAEMLWVVLANVSGGDWTKQSPEWQEAAARWRDNYFASLKAMQGEAQQTEPDFKRELFRILKAANHHEAASNAQALVERLAHFEAQEPRTPPVHEQLARKLHVAQYPPRRA